MDISQAAQEAWEAHVAKWAHRRKCSFDEAVTWLRRDDGAIVPDYPPPSDHPGWMPSNSGRPHWYFSAGMNPGEEALEELKAKGRDPKKRWFNGRIVLELRCRPKGHFLGAVYPTSKGYLLVQAVRGPRPHWKPASVSRREAEERFKAEGFPFRFRTNRDEWYHELDDPHRLDEESPAFMEAFDHCLVDWPRDPNFPTACYLYCRCGLRISPLPWELAHLSKQAEGAGQRGSCFC